MKFKFASTLIFTVIIGAASAAPSESLITKSNNAVTTDQLNDFVYYAQHTSADYCNTDKTPGSLITCNGGCPILEQHKVTISSAFTGLITGIGGFVAIDDVRREIVLAIRGSTNIRNFIFDFQFLLADCDVTDGAAVHSGFLSAWNEISDRARKGVESALAAHSGYRFVIAGHSLGAGVATVAASYLRRDGYAGTDLYTYGSPRVGNAAFANFVTSQQGSEYRVTHYNDITPVIPPLALGYRHTSMEYWLSTGPETKLDYEVKDIRVCEGNANLSCSGSVLPSLTLVPHRYILADLYACGGLKV
ncbi:hypothetical protein V495_02178 [Pseudogymnoascus sp. VKM F-4514 (FW-929)]|nr:hypothetical protein V495_02178 [Pseudogymnoascus sp. VKM F-4514 (FW-929)]KFY64574.1 hypothetical protein V497_01669 [Pseudogymnoascus sp. VKM F-4516 (FW-969)]